MVSVYIHQPHDKFLKKMLHDKRVAKDIFNRLLAPSLRQELNFKRMRPYTRSFIDKRYRAHFDFPLWEQP